MPSVEADVLTATIVTIDPLDRLHLNVQGRGLMYAHVDNNDIYNLVPGQAVTVHVVNDRVTKVEWE